MEHEISISRALDTLGHPEAEALVEKAVTMALDAENIPVSCMVDIMLTDEDGIRTLNRSFRNVDAATDVLSFPMNELCPGAFDEADCERDPESGRILLGDMMLCIPRCAEQGEEFGHGFERELMYLSVHSILHLLGYDHVDEGIMKKQMRQREKEIMGDKG